VARINAANKTLLDQPDLWSANAAWAYPAAAANSVGVAGFTAFYGGGATHPSHVVGLKNAAAGWSTAFSKVGTHSPPQQSWGDYLSCTPYSPDGTQWVASGYTLQGGTNRANIEPRFVHFRA
jgi:hypothetical protein